MFPLLLAAGKARGTRTRDCSTTDRGGGLPVLLNFSSSTTRGVPNLAIYENGCAILLTMMLLAGRRSQPIVTNATATTTQP